MSSGLDDSTRGNPVKYDDRTWQSDYLRYCKKQGPPPGRHPDPNHPYNRSPELYNFGDDNSVKIDD